MDSTDVEQLLAECSSLMVKRYHVVCGLVARTAHRSLDDKTIRLCVVVNDDLSHRIRRRMAGRIVDIFVMGAARLSNALENGEQHLVNLCAAATCAFGEQRTADKIIAFAKTKLAGDAPQLIGPAAFRFECQPFDLLREFNELRQRDTAEAAITLAALVRTCTEGFFAVNRLWSVEPGRTLAAIASRNPQAAAAIRRVVESPISVVCERPELADDMVRLTVGAEGTADEVQLGQPSATRTPPASTPKKPQRPAHTQAVASKIPQAIRSYTSWRNTDPIKEAVRA